MADRPRADGPGHQHDSAECQITICPRVDLLAAMGELAIRQQDGVADACDESGGGCGGGYVGSCGFWSLAARGGRGPKCRRSRQRRAKAGASARADQGPSAGAILSGAGRRAPMRGLARTGIPPERHRDRAENALLVGTRLTLRDAVRSLSSGRPSAGPVGTAPQDELNPTPAHPRNVRRSRRRPPSRARPDGCGPCSPGGPRNCGSRSRRSAPPA
jgi:hypothetical protein